MTARRAQLWVVGLFAFVCGCKEFDLFPFRDQDEQREKNARAALRGEEGHSRLIGDYVNIAGLNHIKVQGIGLVDRLDGTGEDPPASPYRKAVLDDIRRYEIENPESIVRSANTAIVIVTAYIPPLIKKGDKIDVEIQLPPGSQSTSLNGGWLMPCHLTQHELLGGAVREGHDMVIATGPVLTTSDDGSSSSPATASMRGSIPAGGVYVADDRNLMMALRSDYRSIRMSTQIAQRIGRRFHDYDEHGIKRPLAKPLTDAQIELIVQKRYRDNYARYLQCIQHISLTTSAVDQHLRMRQLEDEVMFGPTAERAALQLEGIGPEAIPVLKRGLKAPSLEARFHCAVALAYLGNADGVDVLKVAAESEPAFRIFALVALSTIEDGAAAAALRSLMSNESIETRYGAFRALSTLAPNDPFIGGADMDGKFMLHPVDSGGPPLIHLTRRKKSEIVLFGAEQRFRTPMFVRAGRRLMVQASPSGDRVTVSRIAPGEADRQREVSTKVADVIAAASELGASYPDIVQMLVQAKNQHNLPGEIGIDQLPRAGRIYRRPTDELAQRADDSEVQVGSRGLVPNLFETDEQANGQPEVSAEVEPDAANLYVQ